jgi:hypothetical protein
VVETLRRRAKCGAGLVATGLVFALALAVVPTMTASAALESSSICQAYQAIAAQESSKSATALAKDLEAGKWPVIQKAMLSAIKGEINPEKELVSALNGASAKVKAAARFGLAQVGKLKTIVENSKSEGRFETADIALESSPKFKAAENVLDRYTTKLCGSITPAT